MGRATLGFLTGGLALLAPHADGSITAIYSEIAADPSSLVPAGAGVPAGTLFLSFDRPYRSPDGLSWIISAGTSLLAAEDEVIIVGAGAVGATVVREGTAFGTPTAGELVGLIDRNLGLTNAGEYVFATNTSGPTVSDEYIVRFDGVGWVAAAQEGAAVPTMPTELLGISLDSASILSDGVTVAYRAPSTVGALGIEFDDFLIRGAGIDAQEGTTIPGNQALGATEFWDNFAIEDYYVSSDGLTYVANGDLMGATTGDGVVVVNGDVVIQEDSLVPGTGLTSPIATIVEAVLTPNGRWFVRGGNDDLQDWVVSDGDLLALRSEPIVLGTSEVYSDVLFAATFFWMAADGIGNYVIGGTTSNPDVEADAVLVLNGTTVLARQGDPVDLNGNGLPDDDAFIDIFNNDDGFLTDAGLLYFTADLQDGLGAALGQGLLLLDTTRFSPCPGDIVPVPADGVVDVLDFLEVLGDWGPCPVPCETSCPSDVNGDCVVDVVDFLEVLANWGPC